MKRSYTKNCMFDDLDISFTTKFDSAITRGSNGYTFKIQVPKMYVQRLMNLGVHPYHKGPNYWVLSVKITNRTVILLNGKRLAWYDGASLDDIPKFKLSLNQLVLRKYSEALQTEYRVPCYATRIVLKEDI